MLSNRCQICQFSRPTASACMSEPSRKKFKVVTLALARQTACNSVLSNGNLLQFIMAFLDIKALSSTMCCSKFFRTIASKPRLWTKLDLLRCCKLDIAVITRLIARPGDKLEFLTLFLGHF